MPSWKISVGTRGRIVAAHGLVVDRLEKLVLPDGGPTLKKGR